MDEQKLITEEEGLAAEQAVGKIEGCWVYLDWQTDVIQLDGEFSIAELETILLAKRYKLQQVKNG